MTDSKTTSPDDRTIIGGEEGTPPKGSKKLPYLVMVEGPRAGTKFPLAEGKNTMGRAQDVEIRLEDQSVSRHHAEIEKTQTGWLLRDLGSKNGTLVNGSPVKAPVVIGHKDVINAGIYYLRLITQEVSVEEEMAPPPAVAISERTVMTEIPSDGMTAEMEEGEALKTVEEEKKPSRLRQYVFLGISIVCVMGTVGFLTWRYFLHPAARTAATAPAPLTVPSESAMPPPPGGLPVEQVTPSTPPSPQTLPVFLDFASSPLPATVTFQGKELGKTPLRVNLELEPDREYTAQADFFMPELQEHYTMSVNFKLEVGKSVIPILFRGPIGMMKVNNLPREVQFYLEGNYDYDRFKQRPAKLGEVILQKPIYIPYGHYQIELRQPRQLGETQTFVQDIVFRREFNIAEDSPSYALDVKEDDLRIFPVDIKSDPSIADVFIDGKLMGKTPYQGFFPLGDHTLTLRKEGYFENTQPLHVDINTPFTASIKLDTSVSGAHINNAKAAMIHELYQQAINELAQALAANPASSESAEVNYLLGRCYLSLGDVERSLSYFDQSKGQDQWKYPSMLGMVAAYATMKRMDAALPVLVDVLLNTKDEDVKREAHSLFQQISPFRSVIYVYSEPEGANIIVNDKPVAQLTPAILHDLPLGSYQLRLEKPGYQPLELKLSLSVNEFNPVIVKLKPVVQ